MEESSRFRHEPKSGMATNKVTILLADDSKFLRLAIERALARAGYTVLTANDGEQALRTARESAPQVILLDMLLPKISGLDVLKALKKDPLTAGIAVVAFTALSNKNAERLQRDGVCAYLEKSDLCLNQGCEKLLSALAHILKDLDLKSLNSEKAAVSHGDR
jgi:CheY-like chemotaxis protein